MFRWGFGKGPGGVPMAPLSAEPGKGDELHIQIFYIITQIHYVLQTICASGLRLCQCQELRTDTEARRRTPQTRRDANSTQRDSTNFTIQLPQIGRAHV